MNVNEVIKYPILSEKTYKQMAEGIYTFAVDVRTNKIEVKKVVEFIFDVKVSNVNMISVPKKPKKLGRYQGFTNRFKKAIVKLADGQINIFPDEAVNNDTKKEEPKKVEKAKISDAEKKAAEKIAKKLEEKKRAEAKEAKVTTPDKKPLEKAEAKPEKTEDKK